MANLSEGTVLTCVHEDCDCRIRIESKCTCADAGASYVCTCGAPMVEVTDGGSELPRSSPG
jgi:metallothionein